MIGAEQGGALHILFINRYFYPDACATSQLLSDLAFYLAERGHTVRVVTSRQRYDDPAAKLAGRQDVEGVEIHRCWGTAFGRGRLLGRAIDYLCFYIGAFAGVLRWAQRGGIVVVTTDPPLNGVVMAPAIRLRGARQVNWLHDIFPETAAKMGVTGTRGLSGSLLRHLRDRNCREAAMNVVIGEGMQRLLVAHGVPGEKLAVIPNWAPHGVSPCPAERNPLRREWQLNGKFVVGYAGNLGRVHEFDTLIAAAQQLGEDESIIFLIIGGGAKLAEVKSRVIHAGLGNVLFRAHLPREQLSEGLSAADLHIVTLRPEFESLVVPSKIYGIAAVGRPAVFIGDIVGEAARVLANHGFGYAVEIGDTASLVAAIRRLAADTVAYAAASRHAVQAYHAHFAAPVAFDRWERVLRQQLGNIGSGGL